MTAGGTAGRSEAFPFAAPLRAALRAVDDAIAVALIASDGMVVHQERAPGTEDLSMLVAHQADQFRRADAAAFECGLGRARETVHKTTTHTVIVLSVTPDYALMLLTGPRAFSGRGRWELRKAAEQLRAELVL